MTRRCSHCSNNGHNLRTCPSRCGGALGSGYGSGGGGGGGGGGGVKLFGVRLTDGSIMKKSASMGNLLHYHSSPSPSSPSADPIRDSVLPPDRYLSDDPSHTASSSIHRADRKKGIPWTEEEHRMFLIGLKKLGKGDWRGISRNYVVSRTPTQVASHAQKYFIRQTNSSRRKRRSSLFDMDSEAGVMREEEIPHAPDEEDAEHLLDGADATMDSRCEEGEDTSVVVSPVRFPAVVPAFLSVPLTMWVSGERRVVSSHEVLKPIPLLPKKQVDVDQLVGLSELSLRETNAGKVNTTPPHTFNFIGSASRGGSAFHVNTAAANRPA